MEGQLRMEKTNISIDDRLEGLLRLAVITLFLKPVDVNRPGLVNSSLTLKTQNNKKQG
jgi:hypothetical protein